MGKFGSRINTFCKFNIQAEQMQLAGLEGETLSKSVVKVIESAQCFVSAGQLQLEPIMDQASMLHDSNSFELSIGRIKSIHPNH